MVNVTKEKLQTEIASGKKVVVDYYADWCGPCKMLTPVLEKLEKEYPDVCFYKVNIEEEYDLTLSQSITSVPTLLFYSTGENKHRISGAVQHVVIKEAIDNKL
jgi:thioredoxin 1